jgi:hypothetical protein
MEGMFRGCNSFTYDLSNWVSINPKFKEIIPNIKRGR